MLNNQKPEPQSRDNTSLDFHSMFLTLQGEGPFTGRRSVFIRLAGCNLQCPHCDTEYTQGRVFKEAKDLAYEAHHMWQSNLAGLRSDPLIVITGGEPLRQDISELVRCLLNAGCEVQIESNGVFAPSGPLFEQIMFHPKCHLIVSPKTKAIHDYCHRLARAFKYVLRHDQVNPEDGLPMRALGHKATPFIARPNESFKGQIYVNPEDSKDEVTNRLNLQAVANSCIKHGYIAGVQLHKLLELA